MQYFLAVDAGGTKTRGAIGNEERELARSETATIKLLRTSSGQARHNLENLLGELARSQGIDLKSVSRICVGTSGISVPLVANWIRETVGMLVDGELLLCGDEEIALDAAFHEGPGVLVVAGTGSNIVGRTRSGQLAHAGGWGPALADEGSGYWIGHHALRKAFRAQDEGRRTKLLEDVLQAWKLAGIENLVEKANSIPPPDFSALVPVVTACAESGDAVACELLTEAGEELAKLASLVLGRLQQLDEETTPRVAFTGGVLQNIGKVRAAMTSALRRTNPKVEILPQPVDPIEGALWRARQGR
jgi:N-acetylglucosamine kinase-like BadF-type ATPase